MTPAPPDAPADMELRDAFREYHRKSLGRSLVIAIIIPLVAMPAGVVLDYFVYPGHLVPFGFLRVTVEVLLALALGIVVFGRDRLSLAVLKAIGVLSGIVMNLAFATMILLTNGAASPYYSAIILVIFALSILLPWTAIETGVLGGVSFAAYILVCVFNPTFGEPEVIAIFGYNTLFLFMTVAVCVSISFFRARSRFEEFCLRHQLDEQNRQLQDLDRLKTRFFSNISHELRTPLTVILGPIEQHLVRAGELDPALHEDLILVHRNSLRLLKLINDLLDLSRLDQDAQTLRYKEFALAPFVRGMVDSIRHLGMYKQLRIKVEEGPDDLSLVADPSRIEKVLINLLTNAIKYTPRGGKVTVGWLAQDDELGIFVRDTGVGIPAQDLDRIFDRFHQVRENTANQNQGVGIGLALAKELVEHHGGRITVKSTPGAGAEFSVWLPSDPAVEIESESVESASATTLDEGFSADEPFEKAFRSADRVWRSPAESEQEDFPVVGRGVDTILVADDEDDMRTYIVSLLSSDYRVVQTRSGEHVSRLVEQHQPALILLDWMMPGKDGLATCRELRSRPELADLRIMLLTARIDEASKLDALRAGADDFLTKPFSSVEVRTRIANHVRTAKLQRELRDRNTELVETLHRLEQTESMLVQSEKMNALGSLSAGLLHEINNPLNYTLTAVSLIRKHQQKIPENLREMFVDIDEGMRRVRDVVTDLKNFAYPEKPGTESHFSLLEPITSARKILTNELSDIDVHVDVPDSFIVRGQKTQITHVFINLIGNAAKAIRERGDGIRGEITIHADAREDMAIIDVMDNGPGIPEEILTRVFDPFFTTRAVGSGMGMGLSVCHTIIRSHNGSIRAGNRADGGAVFSMTLPITQEASKLC